MKDGALGKGRTQRPMSKRSLDSHSSKDNYDPYEYGYHQVKKTLENETVKSMRLSPRQLAQEAAKRLKKNLATSSGDEDDE